MHKFVWDTSAIVNIKEPNERGYSPGHSLYKDFNDGWIDEPYLNIFPSLAVFEVNATVSRIHRDGGNMLREFYLLGENSKIYDLNQELIYKSVDLFARSGFSELRGASFLAILNSREGERHEKTNNSDAGSRQRGGARQPTEVCGDCPAGTVPL